MIIQVGRRIIFDKKSGEIICDIPEMVGEGIERISINELDFIDLSYGQDFDKFTRVKIYHVDPETKQVIFDELYPIVETEEEKLRREKAELENQLLIQANNSIGGIL